jgi:hypothetical protein
MDEVIFSNVTVAEGGSGCGLEHGAALDGSPGSEIEENDGSQPSLFLFLIHMTQGKPGTFLPMPRSNNARRIFLVRERGLVPAMIASLVTGPDGGTSAGYIAADRDCGTIIVRPAIVYFQTGIGRQNTAQVCTVLVWIQTKPVIK